MSGRDRRTGSLRGLSLLAVALWGTFPSGASSSVISGRVTDAATGDGIDGLPVRLGGVADTTRYGGRFRVESAGTGGLVVDGAGSGYSAFLLEPFAAPRDTSLTIPMIPLGPLKSGDYRNLLHLLKMMTGTGEPGRRAQEDVSISYESSPRTTVLRRWEGLPIRIHVPPRSARGFSWDELVRRAMGRWEERTGLTLFAEVEKAEEAQVRVGYAGGYSRVVFERAAPGGIPVLASMWMSPVLDEPRDVQSAAEHELGHILMLLVHSEDPGHVMYWGGSRGRGVTNDEALVVRCLYGLPNLTDMGVYLEEAPMSSKLIERKRVLAVVLIQAMVALFVILSAH